MRIAMIEVGRGTQAALESLRKDFTRAWKTRRYRGERFGFESPAALFRTLTPKRWELIEVLQAADPLTQRALARARAGRQERPFRCRRPARCRPDRENGGRQADRPLR